MLACIPCWDAGYIGIVLFGTSLPGKPAYAVEWRTLVEVWHCSVNFFYVNQILNWLGVYVIQSAAVSLLVIRLRLRHAFMLMTAWLAND